MKFLILFWYFLLSAGAGWAGDLALNELLAKNNATQADPDGEFDDWIELYNHGRDAVSLKGYFLSDDYNDLQRWAFPDTVIAPGGFFIVWADDDEEQNGLHCNFNLSASGDAVYLVNSRSVIVDKILLGAQTADLSVGRFPDGTGEFWKMTPSFAAPNIAAPLGLVDSSGWVFDEPAVHRLDLHFYTANWADSLRYNFEVLNKEYMPVRLTFDRNIVLDSAGVRYKGNSSYTLTRSSPKKPFKFRFDKYREGQALYDLLKLNLSNGISDPTFMRETIAYAIARRYLPAPRTNYANLYIEGELIGFYVLVEQVDMQFLRRHFNDHSFNLYKASNAGATLKYQGEDKSDYESEYRLRTNQDEDDWSGLVDMLDKLNRTPRPAFIPIVSNCLNLDNGIRYLAFNMVLSNFDSYTGSGRNIYLYDDRTTGQFNIIPWDPNESFGVFRNGWNVITQDIDATSNLAQRPLVKRVLENDSLRHLYWSYIRDMIEGPAATDSIVAMTAGLRPLIESYVRADNNKLYSYQQFMDNLEADVQIEMGRTLPGLRSFSEERNANIKDQLEQIQVYPGDTDNNGVVNEYDILPVGVYFLTTGPERWERDYIWYAHRVVPWETLPAAYVDANGDGLVDEKDVIGIGVNWGRTHSRYDSAYEIDLDGISLIETYERPFQLIYNSLSGEGEAMDAIRVLLRSLWGEPEPPPRADKLYQNYPNPFNQSAVINFYLGETQPVSLFIYNLGGQLLSKPINHQVLESGVHQFCINSSLLTNGLYFYRLETKRQAAVRMMIICK